ncbi:hypothetical protein F5B18DRAFT_611587 [Nemania serpens]|nr:hypothetical protein F5B18DRAFT_611587 [Nemania serpens]
MQNYLQSSLTRTPKQSLPSLSTATMGQRSRRDHAPLKRRPKAKSKIIRSSRFNNCRPLTNYEKSKHDLEITHGRSYVDIGRPTQEKISTQLNDSTAGAVQSINAVAFQQRSPHPRTSSECVNGKMTLSDNPSDPKYEDSHLISSYDECSPDQAMVSLPEPDCHTLRNPVVYYGLGEAHDINSNGEAACSPASNFVFSPFFEYPQGDSSALSSFPTAGNCFPIHDHDLRHPYWQSRTMAEFSEACMSEPSLSGVQHQQQQKLVTQSQAFLTCEQFSADTPRSWDTAPTFASWPAGEVCDEFNTSWAPTSHDGLLESESGDAEMPTDPVPELDYDSTSCRSLTPDSNAGLAICSSGDGGLSEYLRGETDELMNGKSTSTKLSSRSPNWEAERKLACPFVKRFPVEHHRCAKYTLRRIQDVKQHLLRQHCGPEIYCPVCFDAFGTSRKRDDHIRLGNCRRRENPRESHRFRLSDDQRKALRDCRIRGSSENDRWMELWDMTFPGTERPLSPYAENGQTELISSLRRYCDPKVVGKHVNKFLPESYRSDSLPELTSAMRDAILDLLNSFEVAS